MLLYDLLNVIPPSQLVHIQEENALRKLVDIWVGYSWQFIEYGTLENRDVISVFLDKSNFYFVIYVDCE